MGLIWARIGRGCPPSTPRHFWVIFGQTHFSSKITKKCRKNHETSAGRKTVFFFVFGMGGGTNKKDAHRHDSNFHGPMTSPSSIWSPFVKKRVLNNFSENETIFGGRASGPLEMGCGGVAPRLNKPYSISS